MKSAQHFKPVPDLIYEFRRILTKNLELVKQKWNTEEISKTEVFGAVLYLT